MTLQIEKLDYTEDDQIIEIVGQCGGFDGVWLDHEHSGLTISQMEETTRAARSVQLDSFVRLYASDYATVMRPLEAGAGGVMAAQVRSAKEASEIVSWARFHPLGTRGVNRCGVDGRYGTMPMAEYMERANAETLVAIQIERADAVEDVEKIAAVPGVDVLFIGPADLTQSFGAPGQWNHPKFLSAVKRVAQAAKAAGIHWAILPPSVDFARHCVDLGCRMLSIGLDVWVLQRGLRETLQEYATVQS